MSAGSTTPQEFRPKAQEVVEVGEESEREFDDGFVYEDDDDDDDELDATIETNIVMDDDVKVSETAMAEMHIDSPKEQTVRDGKDVHMDETNGTQGQAEAAVTESLFVVDTVGDSNLANGFKANGNQLVHFDPAAEDSDSGEEVIVFAGRKGTKTATGLVKSPAMSSEGTTASPKPQTSDPLKQPNVPSKRPSRSATPLTQPTDQPEHVTDDLLDALANQPNGSSPYGQSSKTTQTRHDDTLMAKGWAEKTSKWEAEVDPNATWAPAPGGSWWKKGKERPDSDLPAAEITAIEGSRPSQPKVAFTEPEAEETIASLQADWKAVTKHKKLGKKAALREDDFVPLDSKSPGSKRRGKRGRKNDNRQLRKDFVEDDDDDEEGEVAYDDYMANLAAQMDGADEIGNGHVAFGQTSLAGSSLVVDGEEIADDEILKKTHFDLMNDGDDGSSSASDEIIGQDLSELSTSDLEDELEYNEQEQWEDEEDLRQRRRDQMTDEQIARMFAKQQEFGYHGDDLVIENGDYGSSDDVDGIGDVENARAGLANISNFTYGRANNKNGGRRSGGRGAKSGVFPDASALADSVDQYGENGFDIMDFDRPSLRPTKKGRKGQLPPEVEALSDDELRENIRETWSNDRHKKALKKAEREEQRMQGLLTSSGKKGKPDLSVKYAFGISMEQVHTELRAFMLDDNQASRPFPPMDKKDRKALHEVANVLNLKSKSIGSGNDRFPTLLKTAKTPKDPNRIDRAIGLSIQGLLSREKKLGNKMARKNARAVTRDADRGGAAAATVRNGEIVGAGAAEIGTESFGHKMMLRMGWSKGMALGKDGEGRLVPVEQVVRLGTAGLG